MIEAGIHIGHLLKKSKFLSFWMFFGYRNNIFIFNLLKTKFVLKMALSHFFNTGIEGDHIFFVNLNKKFSVMVYKYALLIHAGVSLEK
jgi:ribosomal protein S2